MYSVLKPVYFFFAQIALEDGLIYDTVGNLLMAICRQLLKIARIGILDAKYALTKIVLR